MDRLERVLTEEELQELARRKMRLKLILIAGVAVFVLVAGFLYFSVLSTSMGWPRPASWPNFGPSK
jgi:flagellar basal body-associated protein FliL